MKEITILVPESCVIQSIADPDYLFSVANQFLAMHNKKPLFNITLAGINRTVKLNNDHFSVHPEKQISEIMKTDLVIIPALFGNMDKAVALNKKFIPWIVEQYNNGAEIASLCVGAFLLASTGLLNGRKCSTHWGFMDELKEKYPDTEVVEGKIITEENRIYSSGGANSYWNLLLYLLEKYSDRETAILASKYFAIDIDRHSQSAFALFKGQKNHRDDTVKKVQEYIEKNINEKINIDELAEMAIIGRRSLERRFKKATHNSVLEYIQRVKIEAAKRSFENSQKNVTEVMFDIGYSDSKAFRTVFKKITGLTPVEYKNKYNKIGEVA